MFLQRDNDDDTPLHCASGHPDGLPGYGHPDIVEFLAKSGAKLDEVNKQRNTALIIAVKCGHAKICEILAKKGAKVNSFDGTVAPIFFATQNGDLPVCKILVRYKAELNVVS